MYDPLPLHTALLPPKTNAERARAILQAHLDGNGIPLDVNAVDRESRTALHFAAALGLPELVEMLVQAGADVNVQDSQGLTALHMACGYARPTTVRALVEAAGVSLRLELRDSRNRTAQQLVEELLAQEQPRKFGGLFRNSKHEAYAEIVSILKEFCGST
jgi:ankyrin repeat protein